MISAISSILKQKSAEQGDSQMNKLSTKNTFFLSENKLINFDEFRCKQYYELFITDASITAMAFLTFHSLITVREYCEIRSENDLLLL